VRQKPRGGIPSNEWEYLASRGQPRGIEVQGESVLNKKKFKEKKKKKKKRNI